eukprot:458161-Prorocentrum_minimum.AAC.1
MGQSDALSTPAAQRGACAAAHPPARGGAPGGVRARAREAVGRAVGGAGPRNGGGGGLPPRGPPPAARPPVPAGGPGQGRPAGARPPYPPRLGGGEGDR